MRYDQTATTRDGFALPIALFAIVIIGALVTGGFYASSQQGRIATSTDLGNRAFYAAEYGLNQLLGKYKNSDLIDDFEGDTVFTVNEGTFRVSSDGRGVDSSRYTIHIRWLNPNLFLVRSVGEVYAGQRMAQREVGSLVRTLEPVMPAPAALAIYGGLTVGGNSYIKGNDNCTAGDSVSGVTAIDTSQVSDTKGHITGSPPVEEDATLDTSALSDFGSMTLDDLKAMATNVYDSTETSESNMQPVTSTDTLGNTVCEDTVRSNWGDPNRATPAGECEGHFPIIHAKGDLKLQTGTGQGILIVDGNLKASGNFDFYGVVIVLGTLETTGTGNHFEGSVLVQGNGNLDSESTTLGNSLVQYNECTTRRAFNQAFRPRPLAARSWMDFTGITRGEATD